MDNLQQKLESDVEDLKNFFSADADEENADDNDADDENQGEENEDGIHGSFDEDEIDEKNGEKNSRWGLW
jgi:hypothetical protein